MYDFSVPNSQPGTCAKCNGSGTYGWGAMINGVMQHSGPCFSCKGTGQQDKRQIKTNRAYNYYKMQRIGL